MFGWLFGKSSSPIEIEMSGDGTFSFEIVGESYYQATLKRIAGPKDETGKEHYCEAVLVCEDDNQHDKDAVAVKIMGSKVGHLSRTDSKEFRYQLKKHHPQMPRVKVEAVVVGGWKDAESEGHYGVRFDF